jgi:micrococcal nuclease
LIRTNRENRVDRNSDRKDRRKARTGKIAGYFTALLVIICIVSAIYSISQQIKTKSYYKNKPEGSQTVDIIDAQAVRYGKTVVAKVNSVYDGDTLNVDIKDWPPIVGKSMPVRINKIDTPEINSKNPNLKALAIKARDYVRNQLKSASIIELRNIKRDKYFRLDADLFADNIDIANELLKQGLAKPYDGGTKSPWSVD